MAIEQALREDLDRMRRALERATDRLEKLRAERDAALVEVDQLREQLSKAALCVECHEDANLSRR